MRCLALFLASVCTASAQVLPDPGNATVSIPSFSAGSIQLPQASYARSMAQRTMGGLSTLAGRISSNNNEIARLRGHIAEELRRKALIEAERDRAREDYRKGHFCSTCGKAKSKFASEREFWDHIAEGAPQGRRAVPATSVETEKMEAEFADKLREVDSQIQTASDNIRAKERENEDGLAQMREGIALWNVAREMEPQLLRASLIAAEDKDNQDLSGARRQLVQLEARRRSAVGTGDKSTVEGIDAHIAMWRQVIERVESAGELRYANHQREIAMARETANKEYAAISGLLGEALRNSPSMAAPVLPVLPDMSISVGDVTLFSSATGIGAKFRFGSILQGGISASAPDAVTTETRQFFEIMGRLRISGGYRTRYTPDGIRQGPVFDLDLLPPKGETQPKPAPDKPLPLPQRPP